MPELNLYLHQDIRRLDCDPCISEIGQITGFNVKRHKLNVAFWECYSGEREQFDASCILKHFQKKEDVTKSIIITDVDLYLPIFTFVFGLAQLGGNVGIISIHRLNNKHYGLPDDVELLKRRMKKEIIHEFGHLIGMKHCADVNCVMASANNIDDLDIRPENFCPSCQSILAPILPNRFA